MADTGVARIAVKSQDADQTYVSVSHWKKRGDGQIANLISAIGASALVTALTCTLETIGTVFEADGAMIPNHGDTTPPPAASATFSHAGLYSVGSRSLPDALVGLVNLHTNVARRGAHGWTYGFPAYMDAALNTGQTLWDTTHSYWTQLALMATDYPKSLTASDDTWDLVVFSKTHWKAGDSNFAYPVVAISASTIPRWLRKRSTIPRR